MKTLKHSLGLLLLLLLGVSFSPGQVTLVQESFETDGEGTRYTSNSGVSFAPNYIWDRTNQLPHPHHSTTIGTGSLDGSYYWAAEDVFNLLSGSDAFVELNPINVFNSTGLEVQIALGLSRFNQTRWESDDFLIVEYNLDNAGWTTLLLFRGNNNSTGVGGLTEQDTDNDMGSFGPFGAQMPGTFTDFTLPITGTGTTLQVRVRTNLNGSEEMGFDNIRVQADNLPSTPAIGSGLVCDPANNVMLGNDIINLAGTHYDATANETYFFYCVTSGSSPAISHLTFTCGGCDLNDLPFCANNSACGTDLFSGSTVTDFGTWAFSGTGAVISSGSGSPVQGCDGGAIAGPNSGYCGLKFDQGFADGESRMYYYTLSGNWAVGTVSLISKGGPGFDFMTIPGPDCGTNNKLQICCPNTNGGVFTALTGIPAAATDVASFSAIDAMANIDNPCSIPLTVTHSDSVGNGAGCIGDTLIVKRTYTVSGGAFMDICEQYFKVVDGPCSTPCPTLSNETADFITCVDDQGQTLSVETDDPNIDIEFYLHDSPQTDPYDGTAIALATQLGSNITPTGSPLTASTTLSPSFPVGEYWVYAILDTDDPDLTDPTCRPFALIYIEIKVKPTPVISGLTSYCEGTGGVTLDAGAGFSNYLWSPGNETTQMITVTDGSYTVTVTDANGCSGTSPAHVVSENSNPTPVISGPTSYCEGTGGVTLDAGAGFSTYLWSPGNQTTQMITVTDGSYTVTVTDANGCSGTSPAHVVSENSNPTPVISGPTSYCEGTGGVTLDAGAGFSTYLWSPGNQTTQTITVTDGSYTVTVTDANGCSGTSPAHVVSENPNPTPIILGPTEYCVGTGGVTLDAGAGFSSYLWSPGGEMTQTISGVLAGTYSVTVTDANGCTGTSVDVTVTEESDSNSGDDNAVTVCETTVVDLLPLVSVPGGSFSDPAATGGLSGSDFNTTGLPPGEYDIIYTVAGGSGNCGGGPATITITVEENIDETCVINTYDTSHPDDHAFVFFDFPKVGGGNYLAARYVWETPGQFMVNADGTATITGKVKLKQDNNVKFDVYILLENKMDWPTWSGLGRTYAYKPATQAVAALEHVNWDYYEMSASSNLTGCAGSTYDGDVINLTHKPADYSMGFQVGFAANEKDDDKGIAGWFYASGTLGGVNYSDWGDMNADLDCSFSNCIDCTVDFTTVNSPEICNGSGGGQITVNATGGSGVYDFSDDGGANWITGTGVSSVTFVNLSGMIELRVRDANDVNCRSDIRYIDLTGPSPDFTTSTVDASCADREDGSIDINVTAGNGPFMYAINGGAFVGSGNTHTFSGLPAADHSIQVKDANGCISDPKTVTTGTNNPPAFDVSITHESSPGANDGAITVTVTSGVPSFLFSNDNGATLVPGVGNTHIFTGLTVGFYDLLVEDGNGCQSTRLPAFVSGAGFCPPTDLIDGFFTAHPGNDGKNARFMCEDQSPHLLYELTGLSGGNSFYLDWEVSGFQGKATGDRPTVDGVVPATDGSVGGSTASTTTNGIHTFDANGKVFGLEDNVNSMRRISLAVQPYIVNSMGTVCPANPDTWKVYVYKRAQAELDNAIVPGTAIVVNSGDDPTAAISIDQTSNIKEYSNGTLIYDLHIDPNPDITELAAGLDLSNVGLSENDDTDNDFEDIDLGLSSLTNTSGGAVNVTVEVTPKFDPNHSRAADKDPISNPDGYCEGTTQTIDIIVNAASPRKANNTMLINGQSVNFRLYPNPAETYFFLQASAVLEQAQKFEITNMLGQTLVKGQIDAGDAREKVEVQHLPAGVYMVRITNEQGPDALIRFEKMH